MKPFFWLIVWSALTASALAYDIYERQLGALNKCFEFISAGNLSAKSLPGTITMNHSGVRPGKERLTCSSDIGYVPEDAADQEARDAYRSWVKTALERGAIIHSDSGGDRAGLLVLAICDSGPYPMVSLYAGYGYGAWIHAVEPPLVLCTPAS